MSTVAKPAAGSGQPKTSGYSTPGEGPSTLISVVTMIAIFALWWITSHLGWMPPLFLPTPENVFEVLWESARGQLTDAPLATHFGWSMFRVFSAFFAACLTAIHVGIGERSKVLLIYLACFAPLAMSARAGVRSVSQEQIHAAYSMGASRTQVITHVVIPAAMPEILSAMRISSGFGL